MFPLNASAVQGTRKYKVNYGNFMSAITIRKAVLMSKTPNAEPKQLENYCKPVFLGDLQVIFQIKTTIYELRLCLKPRG